MELKLSNSGRQPHCVESDTENSYNFHTYAATRIQVIRESTVGYDIEWPHVARENNLADILTRSYSVSPEDQPWSKMNMETCLDM